nr:RNA-directed DNA polymerase, eukaryota, reverse transcriptase zinc-binding domain protein [Tanacetum cinerariifolium]
MYAMMLFLIVITTTSSILCASSNDGGGQEISMIVDDQTTMHDAGMRMSKANPVQIGKLLLEDGKVLTLSRKLSRSRNCIYQDQPCGWFDRCCDGLSCDGVFDGRCHPTGCIDRNQPCDDYAPYDQDDISSDEESQEGDVVNKADNNESDVDRVSKSSFMHEHDTAHKDVNNCKKREVGSHSEDPFNIYGSSVGCSGGILCMWNPNMFVKEQVSTCDYFVALMGTWAPTSSKREGDTVIMGDFNEVRSEHERFGSMFNRQWAIAFNNFISSACLIDLPLEGYAFTWAHKSASKTSKLDRYLISEEVDKLIDQGKSNDEILIKIITLLNDLHELNNKNAMRFLKKPKSDGPLKVDFEKAFDSVKWDYLDETLKAFGYGSKWHNWISSCHNNAISLKQIDGIGVSSNVVAAAASLIGCSVLTAPFNYLGVKVGSNMSRITSRDDVISKVPIGVLNHLESFHRNFFYGVDGSDRKIAWIGWNMWVWRFLTDGSSLWTHFIKAIFGNKGALDTHKLIPRRSPWQDVILAIHSLQSKGENTSFWDDSWLGDVALKVLYKRLYALEMCKSISAAEKIGHPSLSHSFRRMPRGGVEQENYNLLCSKVTDIVLPNISDRWCWSLEGSQESLVKSSRVLIDNTIMPKAEVPTRWLRVVPIKVNVHAWRVCLDKLPTRANLSLRGMDIPSIACPLCNSAMESSSHIFFACPLARQKSIALWEFSAKACSLIR